MLLFGPSCLRCERGSQFSNHNGTRIGSTRFERMINANNMSVRKFDLKFPDFKKNSDISLQASY